MQPKDEAQLTQNVETIKKLLILIAMLNGATTGDLSKVLGVSTRRIQQLMPTRSLKKGTAK